MRSDWTKTVNRRDACRAPGRFHCGLHELCVFVFVLQAFVFVVSESCCRVHMRSHQDSADVDVQRDDIKTCFVFYYWT